MMKAESRIGNIKRPAGKIYDFLSDFRNYTRFIPGDRISNWKAEKDSCRFSMDGLGEAGLRFVEKESPKLLKITGEGPYSIDFFVWIQIRELAENDSRIKLTLQADLNAVMTSMAKKPVDRFMDIMVDYLEKLDYE